MVFVRGRRRLWSAALSRRFLSSFFAAPKKKAAENAVVSYLR
jgi:hypothetical protein